MSLKLRIITFDVAGEPAVAAFVKGDERGSRHTKSQSILSIEWRVSLLH